MGANPFNKCGFSCYREWEAALLDFFVKESASPETAEWLLFAVDDESRKMVAFSALLLSNLLENKPGYKVPSDKAGEVYAALKNESMGHVQYGEWLRSGWLNVSRIADSIKFRLKD